MKKAQVEIATVFIVLLVIVFLGWLVNIGQKECRGNNDCGENSYCGSDFQCHKIPIIEKTSTKTIVEKHYTAPAIILGLCMIITAIILRWDKLGFKMTKKTKQEQSLNIPVYYERQDTK